MGFFHSFSCTCHASGDWDERLPLGKINISSLCEGASLQYWLSGEVVCQFSFCFFLCCYLHGPPVFNFLITFIMTIANNITVFIIIDTLTQSSLLCPQPFFFQILVHFLAGRSRCNTLISSVDTQDCSTIAVSHVLPIGTIGHFQVPMYFCFKMSLNTKPFLWTWLWFSWKWTCRHNLFSYEWFCTSTSFKTEVQENSEWPIVHSVSSTIPFIVCA